MGEDGRVRQSPAQLLVIFVAGLRRAGVAVPAAASALADGDAPGHVFLLRLAATLAVQNPPVVVVLDDLHLVTDTAMLDGLSYVLRYARPGLRVLAASRMDPLLRLHRYRLAGELTEIRAGDLAFTVPEAELLMDQHGVALPAAALESVHERNEGWAAGLSLAAIALAAHPDPEPFTDNLVTDDAPVTGYLVEEALNVHPPGIRDLLLRTSILGAVNAGIAADLVEDSSAASALPALAQGDGFVHPAGRETTATTRCSGTCWPCSYAASSPANSLTCTGEPPSGTGATATSPQRPATPDRSTMSSSRPGWSSMNWPWVAQIGADCGGFYSYQWLENLIGCQVRNAATVHPEWAAREGGELRLHPKAPPLRIVSVEPGRALVAYMPPVHGMSTAALWEEPSHAHALARKKDRWMAASWLFFVEPVGPARCQVISRYRCDTSDGLLTRLQFGPTIVEPVSFAMDRRMLIGIKQRGERERHSASRQLPCASGCMSASAGRGSGR